MIQPKRLHKGDSVAIVSLSSGMLGEDFCSHQVKRGIQRLKALGLEVVFMPNALKGIEFIAKHPDKRAEDLKRAFLDDEIKGIICAIGGVDSFRTLSYLLDDEQFVQAVQNNPKLFTGFSDSTITHLMLYKLGLSSYYGANLLCDFAELADEMLPYTKAAIENYYFGKDIFAPITPSALWYEERTDFSVQALGTDRIAHRDHKGFELLQGTYPFTGTLLGGCLQSLGELLLGNRFAEQKAINDRHQIVPSASKWQDCILFIESSEATPDERMYRNYLQALKKQGIFERVSGIVHGKTQNEINYQLYKQILIEVVDNPSVPIVYNVNFGHGYPRTVLAYGVEVVVSERGIEYTKPCIA